MNIIVLIAFCVIAAAAQPAPCVSPTEWEARVLVRDEKRRFGALAKFSYDAVDKRTRVVDEIDERGEREAFDVLRLYQEAREYTLNLRTRKCKLSALTTPFRPVEIPANAHFDGEAYIGGGDEADGVLVNLWSGNTTRGDRYFLSWTAKSCYPVDDFFATKDKDVIVTKFFDITEGISDPNIFIPRKECL